MVGAIVTVEDKAMTTGDWALIISLCSLAVALGSFVWNVWSKFIYPKAKVRVTFRATVIIQPGVPGYRPESLTLTATNFGPGDVTLHSAILYHRKHKWWKNWHAFFNRHLRREYGTLNPLQDFPNRLDYTAGPFSGGLPKKIAAGESFSSYFTRKVDWFENKGVRVGFSDSFDRNHWCSRQDAEKVAESVLKKNAERLGSGG
jgi:hypothetical protein